MRVVVEVLADDRADAIQLLREAARQLKKRGESSGETVNSCIGDYRITVEDEVPANHNDDE